VLRAPVLAWDAAYHFSIQAAKNLGHSGQTQSPEVQRRRATVEGKLRNPNTAALPVETVN
jgi:hypothetical protein